MSLVLTLACLLLLLVGSAAEALPDNRVYEQVTPTDKNSGDVGGPALNGLFASARGQSSTDGNAITYISLSSFGDAQSGELVTQYISSRGVDGWSTHAVSPANPTPGARGISLSPFHFFSSDLSTSLLDWRQPALTVEAPPGFDNLYVRNVDGSYRLITNVPPPNLQPESYSVTFAGASPDLSHVVFEANDALTPAAPANARSVYEWAGSTVRLVSVLPGPGGLPAASAGAGDGNDDNFADVVSEDGSRIFWTDGEGQLYVREDSSRTVKLNVSRRAPSLGDGTATLRATTPDGSKAIFTDPTSLTEEHNDNGGGIYEYNISTEGLRDLTPYGGGDPGVQGVLGMSNDGSIVYFVASAALAEGATPGANNLYAARGPAVELIATLSGEDSADWTSSFEQRTARVTSDGLHVVFLSDANLTGYNNTDARTGAPDTELFVYDAGDRHLTCVSCNPTGARPIGSASIPVGTSPSYEPNIVSADGSRLFFNSNDALLPAASNGQQNVYEYEDGTIWLISSGTSSDLSALVDTSAEGRDVFFTTRSQLVPADSDNSSDIYDARVGGGFAAPPTADLPCTGEACRGPLGEPPVALTPATALPAADEGVSSSATRSKAAVRCKRPRSAKARKRCQARRKLGKRRGAGTKDTVKKAVRRR